MTTDHDPLSAARSPDGGTAPPSPAELAPHLPDFAILGLLGQGGMGAVYRVTRRSDGRAFALKVVKPGPGQADAFTARFVREAEALERLHHPNIVAIHGHGQGGPWCWLLMDLVEGANLREVISTGRLSPAQTLALVPPLCAALQYAHDQGVVHRDLKPENILLDGSGVPHLVDFGLAKLRDSQASALTHTGAAMGTVHYMAPEQVASAKGVDHRADIYALGVVVYELLTGQLPLGRFESPSQRVQVDVRIDEVVLKALERDPERRWQQMRMVGEAVEKMETVPSRRASVTPSWTLRRLDGRRWLWPILAGAASLILAAGWWWWWDARMAALSMLRARLAPLALGEAIPATAAADLDALANVVGAQDPMVAMGTARLAEAVGLRNRIATRLDSAAALGSGEISTLRGDLERLTRFVPADPGLPGWRQRVEHESNQISGLIAEVERLLATEGPLSEPLALRLASAERALRERGALPPELARRVLASQEATRQAIAGLPRTAIPVPIPDQSPTAAPPAIPAALALTAMDARQLAVAWKEAIAKDPRVLAAVAQRGHPLRIHLAEIEMVPKGQSADAIAEALTAGLTASSAALTRVASPGAQEAKLAGRCVYTLERDTVASISVSLFLTLDSSTDSLWHGVETIRKEVSRGGWK